MTRGPYTGLYGAVHSVLSDPDEGFDNTVIVGQKPGKHRRMPPYLPNSGWTPQDFSRSTITTPAPGSGLGAGGRDAVGGEDVVLVKTRETAMRGSAAVGHGKTSMIEP
jgi:hypothetical protein